MQRSTTRDTARAEAKRLTRICSLLHPQGQFQTIMHHYFTILELLNSIPEAEREPEDARFKADLFHEMGNAYFNQHQYHNAVTFYLQAYNTLNFNDKTDADYREIIGYCIDLSDAYMELCDHTNASLVFTAALEAFKQIKSKTLPEMRIGNVEENPKAFRDFYELSLSTHSYLKSSAFKNHGEVLSSTQQENNLNNLFTSLAFVKPATVKPASLLTPLVINDTHSDEQYRDFSQRLVALARQHAASRRFKHAVETIKQAIDSLQRIQQKDGSDILQMEALLNEQKGFDMQRRLELHRGLSKPSENGFFAVTSVQPMDSEPSNEPPTPMFN